MNKYFKGGLSLFPKGREIIMALELKNALVESSGRTDLKKKVNAIAQRTRSLTEQDKQKWRLAHGAAIDVENPRREALYASYHDAMLDGHLISIWGVRIEYVLRSKGRLVDVNGSEDTEAIKFLNRSWFLEYLTYAMETRAWGHSLIQFTKWKDGEFCEVDLVPREHVKPEKGIVVEEPDNEEGWSYYEGSFDQYCIPVGKSKDLGFLLEATPNCISKKYMGQFWDEFAEVFSVPIRIGKTDMNNPGNVSKMTQMLSKMGRMAYGVFPHESEIEIKETSKKDAYMVYDKRMERCDKENSKRVLGQTMLTDDGSSRSQSEVHQDVAEMITISDKRFIQMHINESLIPFLIRHGYPFEGLEFQWDDSSELSHEEQLEVDKWLIEYFDIELDYFKERYNAKITAFKDRSNIPDGGSEEGK